MSLDLYAKIEPYLDFQEEVYTLHNAFLEQVITKDRTNVLDLGCGQGDFLRNLELNEIQYLGIDLSSEQIAICKSKGLNAQCINLCDLQEQFDCITAIFDVINYISSKDLEQLFQCVYNRLEDGGYFIFDINSYFGFDEIAQGTLSIDVDDKFINIDAVFEENTLNTQITLFEKSGELFTKEQSAILQYFHSKEFLTKLLKNTKFKIEEIRDFYLHNADESDKYIFICRK